LIRIDVYHHICIGETASRAVLDLLHTIHEKVSHTMTTQAEFSAQLQELQNTVAAIGDGVDKISAETDGLKNKVAELEAALQNQGNVSPEVDAALETLKAGVASLADKVKAVDDKVPDAPPTP
jgi:uncharacterized phage infection (PIP) family protein YhgE